MIEDLPPAFQQAIQLTRLLGVRYLWIDALCILQDSAADWAQEAAKMADVYAKCFLTISPSTLSSPLKTFEVQGGQRQMLGSVQVEKRYHFIAPGHNVAAESSGDQYPLSTRAWAFQERILSPRTVHLSAVELLWECQTATTCECEDIRKVIPSALDEDSYKNGFHDIIKPDIQIPEFRRVWCDMIEAYSRRALSYPDDRLPALAGIAESILRVRDVDYLAGLWSHDLVFGLCWYAIGRVERKLGQDDGAVFIAPTWPWASVGMSVSNNPLFGWDAACSVVDYNMVYDGPSRTGKVRSGWMMLNAKILSCSVEPLPYDYSAGPTALYAQIRLQDFSFRLYPEREVDYVTGKFINAHLVSLPGRWEYAIVLRLLKGDELNQERYTCDRDGSRYIHVGLVEYDPYKSKVAWPEEFHQIILV